MKNKILLLLLIVVSVFVIADHGDDILSENAHVTLIPGQSVQMKFGDDIFTLKHFNIVPGEFRLKLTDSAGNELTQTGGLFSFKTGIAEEVTAVYINFVPGQVLYVDIDWHTDKEMTITPKLFCLQGVIHSECVTSLCGFEDLPSCDGSTSAFAQTSAILAPEEHYKFKILDTVFDLHHIIVQSLNNHILLFNSKSKNIKFDGGVSGQKFTTFFEVDISVNVDTSFDGEIMTVSLKLECPSGVSEDSCVIEACVDNICDDVGQVVAPECYEDPWGCSPPFKDFNLVPVTDIPKSLNSGESFKFQFLDNAYVVKHQYSEQVSTLMVNDVSVGDFDSWTSSQKLLALYAFPTTKQTGLRFDVVYAKEFFPNTGGQMEIEMGILCPPNMALSACKVFFCPDPIDGNLNEDCLIDRFDLQWITKQHFNFLNSINNNLRTFMFNFMKNRGE